MVDDHGDEYDDQVTGYHMHIANGCIGSSSLYQRCCEQCLTLLQILLAAIALKLLRLI